MGSWTLPLQVPARNLRGPQPVTLGVQNAVAVASAHAFARALSMHVAVPASQIALVRHWRMSAETPFL